MESLSVGDVATRTSTPVCIAGMHRSGTSMITRLLNLCGLYLGPDSEFASAGSDNEEGFWEHPSFVRLNEEALARLGGGWDLPPAVTEGWELQDNLSRLRNDAADLIRRFGPHQIWGWKDPRNSLMLPFWKSLVPNLKILVCLRNPLEVAQSLKERGFSSTAFSVNLWLKYSQRLLDNTRPAERVVTHYNTYFYNPQAELQRVLSLLKIPASAEVIEQACSAISKNLRHSWVTTEELRELNVSGDVLDCYLEMCGEAGAIYDASAAKVKSLATSQAVAPGSRFHLRYLKTLLRRTRSLKQS